MAKKRREPTADEILLTLIAFVQGTGSDEEGGTQLRATVEVPEWAAAIRRERHRLVAAGVRPSRILEHYDRSRFKWVIARDVLAETWSERHPYTPSGASDPHTTTERGA